MYYNNKMISNFFRIIHSDDIHFALDQTNNKYKPLIRKSKYYDRVYLCIEDLRPTGQPNVSSPIKGFLCKKFHDFEFADEYFQSMPNNDKLRSTMIPLCKWVPSFLDSFLLNIYLKKIFWIGKHNIVVDKK